MKEIIDNIWRYHIDGNWIVIPTNGNVNRQGEAIMGKGLALEAKNFFPRLPKELGELLKSDGNHLFMFGEYKIITFPTKNNYWEKSDLNLIEQNLKELKYFPGMFKINFIYLVHLGCGLGQLNWENEVKPLCEKYLDDKFIVVNNV